jgi:two-component system sensor histidine kinase HydH
VPRLEPLPGENAYPVILQFDSPGGGATLSFGTAIAVWLRGEAIIMWEPKPTTKIMIIGGVTALTLGIHYGWIVEPIFGHVHWIHAVHSRFCYIPIVIGAAWFGLRGGLYTASIISVAIIPFIVTTAVREHNLAQELTEIVFYFAIALLAGGLVEREFRSRQKAEEMRLQLERSHKMSLVGQLAAVMAHEIKNPLVSIKGAVEILCDDGTTAEDCREFKAIVLKEVKRINARVTDFLEFARPSEANMAELNLADVIRSCLKQVEPQIRKRDITIVSRIEDPVMVNGDEEKVHQILLNLLLNADDASPDGSSVSVSLTSGGTDAIISIQDSGDGITDEYAARVFEPFFTTKVSGTGLGLAIAKSYIEKHNGGIVLRNAAGGGAVAEVRLPLLKDGVNP